VYSVAFSPDGQTALSGSWDNTLILWEVATGEALRTFEGHTGVVYSVAFSPDGQTALSGSSSTLILWRVLAAPGSLLHWVENNRYVPELTCEQRALYGVDVQCDESGVFPTRTPFPTLTPSPTRVPRTS
jgi:WD40 repeat protein